MTYTPELLEELKILCLFNLATTQEGIKVHSEAKPEAIAATRRLHEKGLITLVDGGYLTSLGYDAARYAQDLLTILETSDITS
ncbi:DNA-binding protein [Litchfieldella qijiaojingensis]|uniref:DNA-binding protein n=2 Tax=Litchfieldella qijiaojingensis TaxID=980347 RepID=A0ABQ2YVB3_9GAMM|nr:TIGR02647 family protein [Halomonas qijiaojingensis]GGX95050.1 DNA-binding protein [Halomonas qijiaojingensis]